MNILPSQDSQSKPGYVLFELYCWHIARNIIRDQTKELIVIPIKIHTPGKAPVSLSNTNLIWSLVLTKLDGSIYCLKLVFN